jgi:hypothetical protein
VVHHLVKGRAALASPFDALLDEARQVVGHFIPADILWPGGLLIQKRDNSSQWAILVSPAVSIADSGQCLLAKWRVFWDGRFDSLLYRV